MLAIKDNSLIQMVIDIRERVDRSMHISFSPPDISEQEIQEVIAALRSGWITTGPRVKKLESELADWIGVGHTEKGTPRCVCLNSQTACAVMSLRLLGIGEGDEVITTAYTYTASVSVICHVGARPILVDTQPDSYEMDYDAVERAITEKTKAIIPVDIGGVPCDYDRIFAIVEQKKHLFRPANALQEAYGRILVLADTAHALGASWKNKMIGNVADFSSFSFHAVKNFTTGEGGAVTWRPKKGLDDEEIYHQFQLLSLHGQSKDALAKMTAGSWEYDIVGTWYKCNMTDVTAAIGLGQFQRYPAMLARRRELIQRYDEAFRPLGVQVLPHYTETHTSSGHLYLTRIFHNNGTPISDSERLEIIVKMAKLGISCNVHYKPLPMHTAYRKLGYSIADFPNSIAQYQNEITLPLHTCLSDSEAEYIIKNYIEVLTDYIK